MNCVIDRETLICRRCGVRAHLHSVKRNCRRGLGDMLASFLAAFGVTKERMQFVTGSKDCGCASRQAAINAWGYRWQNRLHMPWHGLRHRVQIAWHSLPVIRLRAAGRYLSLAWRVLMFRR